MSGKFKRVYRTRAIIAGITLLAIFVVLVGIALYENFVEARESGLRAVYAMKSYETEAGKRVSLISDKPFHAVTVPISVQKGQIFCVARLGATPVLCLFDTGNPNIIDVPSTLPIQGVTELTPMAKENTNDEVASTRPGRSQDILISDLRLGEKPGFLLKNIPAERIFTTLTPPKIVHDNGKSTEFKVSAHSAKPGEGASYGIIGLAAFRHVVLTVDTRAEKLIVRSSKFDITRPKNRPLNAVLLAAQREESDKVSASWAGISFLSVRHENRLTINGFINDRPVRFMVDSGRTGGGVTLSDTLAKEFKIQERGAKGLIRRAYGVVTGRSIPHARVAVGSLTFDCPADYAPGSPYNLIGDELFRRARVTLDYGRNRILIEPYRK